MKGRVYPHDLNWSETRRTH